MKKYLFAFGLSFAALSFANAQVNQPGVRPSPPITVGQMAVWATPFSITSAPIPVGTVTSVGVTNTGGGLTVTGSPVTSSGNINVDIANTIAAAGPIGTATAVPTITFNARGQLTAVTTTAIAIPFTQVTGQATLAQLPSIGSNTVLGNVTGGSAVPVALTTTQHTTLVNAFTSTLSGAAPASGGGTANFLRADGTWTTPPTSATAVMQGRLTLTTATPVLSTTASVTTVFFTPYGGNNVAVSNCTTVAGSTFTEISQALADATKSPAAAAANSNYDVFLWNDGGTLRATRGPPWTSATARGTGAGTTELARLQGWYVNAVAIINGPGANCGIYLGTFHTDNSVIVNFVPGGSSAGGTASVVGLWNYFNRVDYAHRINDSSASWSYTTATWRQLNNSAGNRHTYILGLAEEPVRMELSQSVSSSVAINYAIGLDITSGTPPTIISVPAVLMQAVAVLRDQSLGFHFLQAMEVGNGGSTTANGAAFQQSIAYGRY